MRLYHATNAEAAIEILRGGFQDGPRQLGANVGGVWLSTWAHVDENEGAKGGTRVAVEIPASLVERWRFIEDEAIFVVPAALVNVWPRVLLCDGCDVSVSAPTIEEIRGETLVFCDRCARAVPTPVPPQRRK